jgi:hypothetical protein
MLHLIHSVSVEQYKRRCCKTQLEVPDNRLCNVVTLSDYATQMKHSYFARPGQRVTN